MRNKPNPRRIRRQMYRQRHKRHLRALLGGYFWLPCKRCGTEYGGHEWVGRFSIITEIHINADGNQTGHSATGMCPACEAEMGLIGFDLCQRFDHEWVFVDKARVTHSTYEDGVHKSTAVFDATNREWYCANCGIDRPANVEDVPSEA